jgi:hypothetical protein
MLINIVERRQNPGKNPPVSLIFLLSVESLAVSIYISGRDSSNLVKMMIMIN